MSEVTCPDCGGELGWRAHAKKWPIVSARPNYLLDDDLNFVGQAECYECGNIVTNQESNQQ